MKEIVYLGSSPPEEQCAQVGTEDYQAQSRKECRAYINQLYRFLVANGHAKENLPEGFALITKTEPHDYGSYIEVVAKFNDEDESSWNLALLLEGSGPAFWDEEAKKELGS